ncbi:hypothetical protein GCM10010124_26390 [Pilimelia terevasa]|uniref:Lipoprotein n=1 Tax=Pilimelia terevasa TaxID=53372 RepID=A0A8J3BV44_9ACTN|nr:hypothetical protein [Pilimelia terevasa]GGK32328.1 hypothetical protein GCM10010124_26390 [Pilimelia terevasa]
MHKTTAAIALAALVALAGCGASPKAYTDYLATMSKHGTDAGTALKTRGEQATTERCDQARAAVRDALSPERLPGESREGYAALLAEGDRVFVAACVHAGRQPDPSPSS